MRAFNDWVDSARTAHTDPPNKTIAAICGFVKREPG